MEQQTTAIGKRVVCFGEAMIRLTPPGNERVERTISLNLSPGGAELNTAVTLACLGLKPTWVSRLPLNALGRSVVVRRCPTVSICPMSNGSLSPKGESVSTSSKKGSIPVPPPSPTTGRPQQWRT